MNDITYLEPSFLLQRYSYSEYGMVIHADIPLPELESSDETTPDLIIRRVRLPRDMPGPDEAIYEFGTQTAYIGIGGVGHFVVRSPALVEFDPAPGADPSFLSLVLLGSVMATILLMRGYLAMHASAVAVNGRGVMFLGDKGAGKSTTAATFLAAGHRLLTDDVLPICLTGDSPLLLPGYAQLKLSGPAAAAVPLADAVISPIGDIGYFKSRLRLTSSFLGVAVPPTMAYVLVRGTDFASAKLDGSAALTALMRNAYHARFGTQIFSGHMASRLMQQCAMLACHVPVHILQIPTGLERLGELVRFVERDLP